MYTIIVVCIVGELPLMNTMMEELTILVLFLHHSFKGI